MWILNCKKVVVGHSGPLFVRMEQKTSFEDKTYRSVGSSSGREFANRDFLLLGAGEIKTFFMKPTTPVVFGTARL